MKARSIFLSAIVISALLAQPTFAALPRYEIIDLGTLGRGDWSIATAINEAGQVVGCSRPAGGENHAFLWDPINGMVDLGVLPGMECSYASALNDFGVVVGSSGHCDDDYAFIWDCINGMQYLEEGPSGDNAAEGINNAGQVVGWVWQAAGAFLWDADNGVIYLGTLGGTSSGASAINNTGKVVGTSATAAGDSHAFIWDSINGMRDLGTLGGSISMASGINNHGQVVGRSQYEPDNDNYNAFLWDSSSGMIDLGPGYACAINDGGQIVGYGSRSAPGFYGPAFYWDRHNGRIRLYELLPPGCGWTELRFALDINNRGQIVGMGITDSGESHAFLMTPVPAKTIYVDDDATGANDGSSWADAFIYLQDALSAAWSGDEIWVAQGIYKPDQGAGITPGDREATFQLVNGVTIKGGYADFGEPDPDTRDIDLYETILSGDLNGDDEPDFVNYSENSYHVVTGSGTYATAVLDGVTITAGNANEAYPSPQGEGGGMFNESCSPTVTNCTFSRNSASFRGGVYNSNSSPTIAKCTLTGNFAGYYGGGMCNSDSNPTLNNCTFTGNASGSHGGGMCNEYSNPILTNCSFLENSAEDLYNAGGGGMYNVHSNPVLLKCDFTRNWVDAPQWELDADGGGMFNEYSSPTLIDCAFSYNSALRSGGISNLYSSPTLTNCTFTGNTSESHGGGMYNLYGSNATLINCTFSANYAHSHGGGMDNHESSPTLTNCRFIRNLAGRGGGMYNSTNNHKCNPILINCIFISNAVGYASGGGMYNSGSKYGECSPRLKNCVLSGNSAPKKGGGIYNYRQINASLINCTFTGNSAKNGNALACDYYKPLYPSNVEITNCILWDGGNEIWNNNNSVITITYSDVQGSWPGEGNIDADPCFVQPGYWEPNNIPPDYGYYRAYDWVDGDYHLLPDSPCIDAGDPDYIAEPNETDLYGKPRVINGRIDMGAYEYSLPIPAEARIVPRTINLASKGKSITCYIWLPEDYDVADVNSNSVLLEDEVEPQWLWCDEEEQVVMARFSRSEVQGILDIGEVELKITGQLTDGTIFEATDVIRVIDKASRKSAK